MVSGKTRGFLAKIILLSALLVVSVGQTKLISWQKPSLDEARVRLDKAKNPVDRARAYLQISDILLKEVGQSISKRDAEALGEWSEQYRQAISSARETMVTSGRDAQRDPE